MLDPNRWQPLLFENAVTQNGQPADLIQSCLGPSWGGVRPFALDSLNGANLHFDPGPPPQLGGATDTDGANAGEVNSAGLELEAEFAAGQHYAWGFKNPWWVAFSYTDAVLAEDTKITDSGNVFVDGEKGNKVPYIPEIQVSCATGIEIGRVGVDLPLM